MKNFRQLTLDGLSWNIKNQIFSQIINLIVGILLIRLLSPKDFGLIAMVVVIMTFAVIFRSLALDRAIIQKKHIDHQSYSAVFWIQILTSGLLSLILVFVSPYIAGFYNEPLIQPIVIFFTIEFFISTLGVLQFARLEKQLDYRRIFYIQLISISSSGILALILAYQGFQYWSLVAKSFSLSFFNTLLVWIFSDWKPEMSLNFRKLKPLFHFSLPILGNQFLNYTVRNIDDLLIGKVLGQQALGLYNRAYTLMLMPLTTISKVISNVLFPSFSIIQDDPERIKQIYLKVIQVVALFTFPLMIGLCVLAESFVIIVFGEQWQGIIPVVKILSLLGMIQSIGVFNGSIFLSTGKTLLLFKIEIFSKSFMVGMIVFGLFYTRTIEGVAFYYALGSILALFPAWHYMGKLIGTSIGEILISMTGIFLASFSMGLLILWINNQPFFKQGNIFIFLFEITIGIGFYWLLLTIFKIKAYYNLKEIIAEKLNRS